MLVAAGDIVDDHVTRCRPHDDVAHLDLQGVALQKDGLFFQRQLMLLRSFVIAVLIVIGDGFSVPRTDGELQGVLFQRDAQAGDQLLVDCRVCLYAPK